MSFSSASPWPSVYNCNEAMSHEGHSVIPLWGATLPGRLGAQVQARK